ncbi:MAG: hypothetical protein CMB99_11150 [Flavobacteriaceae bacterium]|nr:hypothetical protein [Flavobacteriaceae bacterium]|tara:strand:+ start:92686 stop:93651 length:966 start_codon:yes stop_codon:yes gene_type:complete
MKLLYSFVIAIIVLQSSYSQTCCSGGVPLSNNIGLPILEKGSIQLGIFYDYNHLNTLQRGIDKLDDASRIRITHSTLLNLGYSITDNFSVEGLFTWVNQRRRINQFGNSNFEQTYGAGDAILIGKYRLLNTGLSEWSLGFGFKAPLGSTTKVNSQGFLIVADLQPGSGAFDYILMSSYSTTFRFRRSLTASSRLIYRMTGENDGYLGSSIYEFGDELQFFLTLSDQFLVGRSIVSPSLSLKYRNVVKDRINQVELENTGGNWLFLIPNFGINLSPSVTFSTNIEVPIYANVKGTQLTPTFRVNTGFSITLNTKNNLNKIIQ